MRCIALLLLAGCNTIAYNDNGVREERRSDGTSLLYLNQPMTEWCAKGNGCVVVPNEVMDRAINMLRACKYPGT
jgi:hypothetical protein